MLQFPSYPDRNQGIDPTTSDITIYAGNAASLVPATVEGPNPRFEKSENKVLK